MTNSKKKSPKPTLPSQHDDSNEVVLKLADAEGLLDAINKSQAVIEFQMDGTILHANQNFLDVVGYTSSDVVGKHHSMFAEPEYRDSPAYEQFWAKLNRGEFDSGEYKRLGKGGKEVWIQASYNPIFDTNGVPLKVVKFATDVTEQKLQSADFQGQLDAISKSQAVIEFQMDGTILHANQNFLDVVGYTSSDVVGKHHSMFAEPEYRDSPAYEQFWAKLNRGEFDSGEYKRLGKGGKEVWIQASYNPIFDMNGNPFKVVKYATDVTERKLLDSQTAAINKAMAIVEFDMSGQVIEANEMFLELVGYDHGEVEGRHHRMFVDTDTRESAEYGELWSRLRRGETVAGEYQCLGSGDKVLWFQATYNPIFDLNGTPTKVVEYVTDVTERYRLEAEIQRAVSETIRVATALKSGDLSDSMTGHFEGQFLDLQTAMNGFISSIGRTILQAKTASLNVAEATEELKAASQHVAQGATEQGRACQISSQALAETSSMVAATATNAGRANELVQSTTLIAQAGTNKMQNLTKAMSDIADSSREIAKIIKVIDEIAFQTNLLAVNAAVEAARAGRHGRGFAVVAQEVRSLAGRSAKAAQATSELIEESSRSVQNGVNNVNETAQSLGEITENVVKVRDLVAEITSAGDEQSKGIAEVADAMAEVNLTAQGAQQQSTQLATAANDLATQSESLRKLVEQFQLREPNAAGNATGGLTPEVLAQIAALVGVDPGALASQMNAVASSGASKPTLEKAAPDMGQDVDSDSRGFGSF